jgi:hypothetical protein
MQPRLNRQFAQVVEQAVVIEALSGAATAWAFLAAYDVPRETILRVLSTASVRRKTDNPSSRAIDKCR